MTEENKAIKYDGEKIRMELLSVDALEEIAKVLTFGAKKYEDNNWRKGFKWSRLIGAALRHLTAWMNGQSRDPETGLSHLAHLGCCVMFLIEHEKRKLGEDDRWKYSEAPSSPPVMMVRDGKVVETDWPMPSMPEHYTDVIVKVKGTVEK